MTIKELNKLNKNKKEINLLDSSGYLKLQLIHLQNLLTKIENFRDKINEKKQDELNIVNKLFNHKIISKQYLNRLNEIKKMYEKELDKTGQDRVEENDLNQELKLLQISLKNDIHFETNYISTINHFNYKDILNKNKKLQQQEIEIKRSQEMIRGLITKIQRLQKGIITYQRQIDQLQRRHY